MSEWDKQLDVEMHEAIEEDVTPSPKKAPSYCRRPVDRRWNRKPCLMVISHLQVLPVQQPGAYWACCEENPDGDNRRTKVRMQMCMDDLIVAEHPDKWFCIEDDLGYAKHREAEMMAKR